MCDHSFWEPLLQSPGSLDCQAVDYADADSITGMAEVALATAPPLFAVAGHSMGGRVALEVARRAPERVQKIVLMDTGYLPRAAGEKGEAEVDGRMALLAIARKDGVRAMANEWVKDMVHPDRLGDAELIEAILAMFERKTAERFARQQHALLSRPDGSPVLAELKMPCLVLCGAQDAWANVAQHEAMHALVPRSQMSVIDGAGHMVLMERPEATVLALRQFLEIPRIEQ